jgi:hypothetical protein
LGPRISITALIFWLLFDQAKSNKGVPTAMACKKTARISAYPLNILADFKFVLP